MLNRVDASAAGEEEVGGSEGVRKLYVNFQTSGVINVSERICLGHRFLDSC